MATQASRDRDIAIVGVAESDEMGTVPNKSSLQHHAEAAYNALEDAGLSKNDVNGLFTITLRPKLGWESTGEDTWRRKPHETGTSR